MPFDLQRFLKTLLFASGEPLAVKDIQKVIARYHKEKEEEKPQESHDGEEPETEHPDDVPSLITATRIRDAMNELSAEFDRAGEVYQLIEGHNGYRLVTRPEHAHWVRLMREEPKPVRLSAAALETLAIIAYRQPVTRSEIEHIRGVSVDSAMSRLLERELVEVVGRADLPGRPIQYGTTPAFLEYVGIKSLEELPASDVLSNRQIDDWLQEASQSASVTESEMGLPEH